MTYRYSTGNCKVILYEDGTRIIDTPGNELPNPEIPLSTDLKITNYCDNSHVCKWCLTDNMEIITVDGVKPINKVETGDKVICFDVENSQRRISSVKDIYSRDYDGELIIIELENGINLKITPEHEIFTNRGWVKASDIKEDDELMHF